MKIIFFHLVALFQSTTRICFDYDDLPDSAETKDSLTQDFGAALGLASINLIATIVFVVTTAYSLRQSLQGSTALNDSRIFRMVLVGVNVLMIIFCLTAAITTLGGQGVKDTLDTIPDDCDLLKAGYGSVMCIFLMFYLGFQVRSLLFCFLLANLSIVMAHIHVIHVINTRFHRSSLFNRNSIYFFPSFPSPLSLSTLFFIVSSSILSSFHQILMVCKPLLRFVKLPEDAVSRNSDAPNSPGFSIGYSSGFSNGKSPQRQPEIAVGVPVSAKGV